jgi:pimeloyl-ACP methyl ester carboxylesterase
MQGARRLLIYTLIAIAALYAVACTALFALQRSLIYFPQPRSNPNTEILQLKSDAGAILTSTRAAHGPGAVIYFGGNAEDVSQDLPSFADAFPNDAIYLLHYPGFGGSAGKPSEKSIMAAAFALFDEVHAQHPNVLIVGRSLGTGVAVQVASQRTVTRLILVTPFDSLGDVAAAHNRLFPVRLLLLDSFDSGKYAPHVTAPTKIIAAGDDEIIPRTSTERLRTRFQKTAVTYVVVPHVGHNSISDDPSYLQLLEDR